MHTCMHTPWLALHNDVSSKRTSQVWVGYWGAATGDQGEGVGFRTAHEYVEVFSLPNHVKQLQAFQGGIL